MNVIIIRSYLNKMYLVSFANTNTHLLQCLLNRCRKYLPTVLYREYYMIQ